MLGSMAVEGESPVYEIQVERVSIPSTTGKVKPCGNQSGPPDKAKYESSTDSALVP